MTSTVEKIIVTPKAKPEEVSLTISAPAAESISGARKAAILCLSLGEEAATALFKQLDDDEAQLLSKELALLPNVKSNISSSIVEEFHQLLTARSYVSTGGVDYAKRLLNNSFGGEHAKRLTDKVMHAIESPASFEVLQKTDPQQIAKLFQSEHEQTIAVVMAHLDPETASTVLQQLPEAQRGEIILRLASLQTVSKDVVKRIANILNQKLSAVSGLSRTSIGGVRAVADICNRLDRETMRLMLEGIEGQNPELSLEIRSLMVTFEDILLIDDAGIREIMQRVDKKVLALALKGTIAELQDRFYTNMSGRAVEMMKEEMDFMGQVKLKDVTGAQREVVEVLRLLDEQGIVSLSGGGGADEYVT
ncbi:MAG: flagellar motor switch protein FliG [Pyrinomonadaceae bacterium]